MNWANRCGLLAAIQAASDDDKQVEWRRPGDLWTKFLPGPAFLLRSETPAQGKFNGRPAGFFVCCVSSRAANFFLKKLLLRRSALYFRTFIKIMFSQQPNTADLVPSHSSHSTSSVRVKRRGFAKSIPIPKDAAVLSGTLAMGSSALVVELPY